jgi:hypothetical protein
MILGFIDRNKASKFVNVSALGVRVLGQLNSFLERLRSEPSEPGGQKESQLKLTPITRSSINKAPSLREHQLVHLFLYHSLSSVALFFICLVSNYSKGNVESNQSWKRRSDLQHLEKSNSTIYACLDTEEIESCY